jgi:hypothetical protein
MDPGELSAERCHICAEVHAQGRWFAVSEEGDFVLAPTSTKAGDILYVLIGCNFPVVLRRTNSQWGFVGDCYVDGHMDREVVQTKGAIGFRLRTVAK